MAKQKHYYPRKTNHRHTLTVVLKFTTVSSGKQDDLFYMTTSNIRQLHSGHSHEKQSLLCLSVYVVWSKLILTDLVPYFIIILLNSFIVVKILKSSQFRARIVRNRNEHQINREVYALFGTFRPLPLNIIYFYIHIRKVLFPLIFCLT